tara:strand:- start:1040 stop:1231 length:192 start_codon:yes stop_codon:yes gene_type:complete
MSIKTQLKTELEKKEKKDLEVQVLVNEQEANELKKIIDAKDKAIEELTKKIEGKLNNLRHKGL